MVDTFGYYLRYKLFNDKIQSPDELICLPTVLILCSLISFILARACIQSSEVTGLK